MKCYRQIPGIKWNWTQTQLRLKRRERTAMFMGVWFDNCSRRTVWVAIPIGQDINKIDIPDLRSTAFAERRGVWRSRLGGSLNPWIRQLRQEKLANQKKRRTGLGSVRRLSNAQIGQLPTWPANISYVSKLLNIYVYTYYRYTYILSY